MATRSERIGHPPGKEVVVGYDKEVMAPWIDVEAHVRKVMQGFSALELLNGDEAESFVRDAGSELLSAIAQAWAEEATALGLEA